MIVSRRLTSTKREPLQLLRSACPTTTRFLAPNGPASPSTPRLPIIRSVTAIRDVPQPKCSAVKTPARPNSTNASRIAGTWREISIKHTNRFESDSYQSDRRDRVWIRAETEWQHRTGQIHRIEDDVETNHSFTRHLFKQIFNQYVRLINQSIWLNHVSHKELHNLFRARAPYLAAQSLVRIANSFFRHNYQNYQLI